MRATPSAKGLGWNPQALSPTGVREPTWHVGRRGGAGASCSEGHLTARAQEAVELHLERGVHVIAQVVGVYDHVRCGVGEQHRQLPRVVKHPLEDVQGAALGVPMEACAAGGGVKGFKGGGGAREWP